MTGLGVLKEPADSSRETLGKLGRAGGDTDEGHEGCWTINIPPNAQGLAQKHEVWLKFVRNGSNTEDLPQIATLLPPSTSQGG